MSLSLMQPLCWMPCLGQMRCFHHQALRCHLHASFHTVYCLVSILNLVGCAHVDEIRLLTLAS